MHTKMLPRNALVAAAYTAMHPDGSLNLEAIAQQADLMVKDGVAGAFICGTTGEGLSLSSAERMQVAARWRSVVPPGSLKVIVHVGHNNLPEAADLARHAEEIGADAISLAAPSYFKVPSVDELVAFCSKVAQAAPQLPFYFYEIPSMTGVNVSMTEFLEKAGRQIPTLAGLKFSSTDLAVLQQCRAFANGRYQLFFGCDEMLLAALALGVDGAVGSTYNYAAHLYHRIIAAFEGGDLELARACQLKSVEMVRVLQPYGVLAAGKALMSLRGVECGPVRLPLRKLCERQIQELGAAIEKSGVLPENVRQQL